jgi:predicted lipid-binding transport protein (Tim44 family)
LLPAWSRSIAGIVFDSIAGLEERNMSKWLLVSAVLAFTGIFAATEVEARRLGGGRTIGAQRNVTSQPAQATAKPAQQQTAPAQQGTQQAAPAQQGAQQAAPAGSRWAPILGGLALGGILGYLFGGSGLFGFLLLALLAIAAVVGVRALMRRRTETPQPVQFAGMRETVSVPVRNELPATSSHAKVPAGFDASGFLRAAKHNFLRLQAAHDAGQLEEIRDFTTEELYHELKSELGQKGETEVLGLEADLLELATEGERHWASVRFSGTVREERGAAPEPFAEVWNLVKPADGSSGWLLAGIQQMH